MKALQPVPGMGERLALPAPRPRLLSEADCQDIGRRLAHYASGGGLTVAVIVSTWQGTTRWGRNVVNLASDVRTDHLMLGRDVHDAQSHFINFNDTSDAALIAALRRAERLLPFVSGSAESEEALLAHEYQEPATAPSVFSEATYQLEAGPRAAVVQTAAQQAAAAGMLSAGYLAVMARSVALVTSFGVTRYAQYTSAQYSVTVRDQKGTGSGWAGMDHWDWGKIAVGQLSATALEKCLKSRNPTTIEPGRYTTILEPQAVASLVAVIMGYLLRYRNPSSLDNETTPEAPFNKQAGPEQLNIPNPGFSMLGEQVLDKRITLSADPMDPTLGFSPFGLNLQWGSTPFTMLHAPVYHPVTWFDKGVLTNLSYELPYAEWALSKNTGLPTAGAVRMSGGETSVDEMIQTTKRGLLVTRLEGVGVLPGAVRSLMCRGYTRDGLWLIENGKISKAVRNLAMTETPLFALNNVEQLGVPQRVFHPLRTVDELMWWFQQNAAPMIVPPLKVRDFSFTALVDAV